MPTQDTSQIKEKILSILRSKGPGLPVHIAREIGMSMLFASAFLSELFSEKKLKISNMKVGNSPLYFIAGQEIQLERYSHYLKSKEKDAFLLLKEKKFLKDIEQEPAIRVALRAIRDFAIPFKRNDKIFWRYFTVSEDEFKEPEKKEEEIKEKQLITPKQQEKPLRIFDKSEETKKPAKKIPKKRPARRKTIQKPNEKFFNKVKEFLSEKQIGISDIIGFSKNDLTLKIIENNQEKLLVAYNKKSIYEGDITKAYKKASELNLPYIILCLGEPLKKITNFINAIKQLDKIEKIESKNI